MAGMDEKPKPHIDASAKAGLRLVMFLAAMSVPFPLMAAAAALFPNTPLAVGIAFLIAAIWFVGFMIYAVVWKPTCPKCKVAKAKFHKKAKSSQEYLTCTACDFSEPTGWGD